VVAIATIDIMAAVIITNAMEDLRPERRSNANLRVFGFSPPGSKESVFSNRRTVPS
jgi:hypothetical protein